MKKLILLILLTSAFFGLNAQDITISFQPKVAGTQIDSTWVTNQKTGLEVKLLGNESLILTKTTGINFASSLSETGYLYPNPCYGDASLSFSTSINQEVELKVYNISGQLLSMKRQYLVSGQHLFQVMFPAIGLYTISVLKDNKPLSYKAVCIGIIMQECRIDYSGSESLKQAKNAAVGKTLDYAQGDILHYSVFSGKNNTIITDSPKTSLYYDVDFYECIDADKKSYPIVRIGNQIWMAENLAYLPAINNPSDSSSIQKRYYIYDYFGTDVNEAKATANYATFGVLYNWPAAMNGADTTSAVPSGKQGACPAGWHLPSYGEWLVLRDYLTDNGYGYEGSGNDIAKSLTAPTHWNFYETPGSVGNNPASNNSSGFTALPGGAYYYTGNFFLQIGRYCYWWTTTEYERNQGWTIYRWTLIHNDSQTLGLGGAIGYVGVSVRCIRNY